MIKPNKINSSKSLTQADESYVSEPLECGIGLPKKVTSAALFAGNRTLVIEHLGAEYQLRLTNQNKLILTK